MKAKDSWNAKLYDGSHSFVSQFGSDLIEILAPKQEEDILDIGCGTGDLTNAISSFGSNVRGIDKSGNMIVQAKEKYPQIHFKVEDVLELEYTQEFDAVFSNATLHWVKEPEKALKGIYNSLKPGGRFVAEFGGKGNVQNITAEIIHQLRMAGIDTSPEQFPWYFPSIGEYSSAMEQIGFKVVFAQHFDRPTPLTGKTGLKNWIEMFAGGLFKDQPVATKEQVIEGVEKNLRNSLFINGNWIADYKRIRIVGTKDK